MYIYHPCLLGKAQNSQPCSSCGLPSFRRPLPFGLRGFLKISEAFAVAQLTPGKTSLSLRPVDHKLLAPAFAYTCTGLAACKFTVRSEILGNFWIQKRLLYVHKFYIAIRLLYQLLPLYPDFSGSRHDALGGIPVSYRRPNRYPTGFFPYTG